MKDTLSNIIDFWFVETQPKQWFQKNSDFDDLITSRFEPDYDLAVKGIYDEWTRSAEGSLALCVLLDQFPRNMFRDTPKAFATDFKALAVAKNAIAYSFDEILPAMQARFLYLPFEHSENLKDQETSMALFDKIKDDDPLGYDYAQRHYDVIKKFGRFPHRNQILERASTAEELAYLAKPDSGF